MPSTSLSDMAPDPALLQLGTPLEEGVAWPRPDCPQCPAGHLEFAEPDRTEHGWSVRQHADEYWEPEWIRGTFTAVGICDNPRCGQYARAVGTYTVDQWEDRLGADHRGRDYSAWHIVDHITPPLALMQLPTGTPDAIQEGVERAAAVLFADPGLAATALRLVVEQFLTSQGVPDIRSSGGFIGADERIKTWKKGAAERGRVADLLLAVKWIGNAGTHSLSTLTIKEVLDGVEFLDEAFHAQFVGPDIDARARAVNAARGPLTGKP